MMRDRGSMFVDAVVGSAVLALTLGTAFQVLGDSHRRQARLVESREALLVGQSVLARVGADLSGAPGRSTGVDGSLVWSVDIAAASIGDADGARVPLVEVHVKVRRSGQPRPLANIRTLRVREAA